MGPRKYLTTVRRKKKKGESRSKEGVFVVERRGHPRIRIELPLDYSPVGREETHKGSAVNASEGGLLVYLPEAMEIGAV